MAATHVALRSQESDKKRERASAYSVMLLLGFVVGLYFVFQYVEQLRELVTVQAQIAEMKQDISLSQQSSLDLQAELQYASSDQYVAAVARGELGYIQDGDEVYVLLDFSDEEKALPTASSSAPDVEDDPFRPLDWTWWQSLFYKSGQVE